MADIKAYRPASSSLSSGQVLKEPYSFDKARVVALEMAQQLTLDLVETHLLTDQIILRIGYDTASLDEAGFRGNVARDWYGRNVPKPAHGSVNLARQTSSTRLICEAVTELFDRIADPALLIRRMYVVAAHLVDENRSRAVQLDLFAEPEPEDEGRERSRQEAILEIRRKFGKNAILTGTNFEEGATGRERNEQIGGHKA